jgi:DNA-binding transcriptional LysR family regulator
LDDALAVFASPHRMMAGNLRISLPVIFGRHWVLPELLAIAQEHPGLELDISLTDRVVDLVEDGVDLAIRVGPLVDSASLVAKLLGVQQAVLSASPGYLEQYGTPRSLADLVQHSCLTFGRRGQTRPWYFLDERGRPEPLPVRGRIGINDSEAIMGAALAGLGISLRSQATGFSDLRSMAKKPTSIAQSEACGGVAGRAFQRVALDQRPAVTASL